MNKSILIFAFAALFLVGCNRKDDIVAQKSPVIPIQLASEMPTVVYPGTRLDFSFTLNYNAGLKLAYAALNGNKLAGTETSWDDAPSSATVQFSYTPTDGQSGSTLDFSVYAEGVDGVKGHYDYPVFILSPIPSTQVKAYSGVVMGANKCLTAGQFFDAIENKVYVANGVGAVCPDIDWCIFWSNNASTPGIAFAAPAASNVTTIYPKATIVDVLGGADADIPANWATRNETFFREVDIDADGYATVTSSTEIEYLFNTGTVPDNNFVVFKKNVGSAFAFKIVRTGASHAGAVQKYGLVRVTERPATDNTGTIVFDYKIAE